jgi:hypothetical protein
VVDIVSIFTSISNFSQKKKRMAYCEDAKRFVQVHYVREKSNERYAFSTLKLKQDPDREACKEWYQAHGNPSDFHEIVNLYLKETGIHSETIMREYKLGASCFYGKEQADTIEKWEAVAICLGLHLNLAQARALLKTAGYALTNSFESDLIIRYCFEEKIYKLSDINYILKKLVDLNLTEII